LISRTELTGTGFIPALTGLMSRTGLGSDGNKINQ
jgi:hypothetical protein